MMKSKHCEKNSPKKRLTMRKWQSRQEHQQIFSSAQNVKRDTVLTPRQVYTVYVVLQNVMEVLLHSASVSGRDICFWLNSLMCEE